MNDQLDELVGRSGRDWGWPDPGPPAERVRRAGRRRRAARIGAAVAACSVVAGVVGLAVDGDRDETTDGVDASGAPAEVQGVQFDLPDGWRVQPNGSPDDSTACLLPPDSSSCVATIEVAVDPQAAQPDGLDPVLALTDGCAVPNDATVEVTHLSVGGRAASAYGARCAEDEEVRRAWAFDNGTVLLIAVDPNLSREVGAIFETAQLPSSWPEPAPVTPSDAPTNG